MDSVFRRLHYPQPRCPRNRLLRTCLRGSFAVGVSGNVFKHWQGSCRTSTKEVFGVWAALLNLRCLGSGRPRGSGRPFQKRGSTLDPDNRKTQCNCLWRPPILCREIKFCELPTTAHELKVCVDHILKVSKNDVACWLQHSWGVCARILN